MHFIHAVITQNPLRVSKNFTLGLTPTTENFWAKWIWESHNQKVLAESAD